MGRAGKALPCVIYTVDNKDTLDKIWFQFVTVSETLPENSLLKRVFKDQSSVLYGTSSLFILL